VYVDGELVKAPTADEHSTICLMVFNGKYTGGGMILDPYACINDGMVDVTWASDPRVNTLMGVNGVMTKAKHGAIQVYDHQSLYYRGKQIIVKFKGKVLRKPPKSHYGQQMFGADGEDLFYNNFVKWDAMKNNMEVMFDTETYFREY